MASGLEYLQGLDPPVAHIDFKSPNIFISSLNPSETCCKIADFGTSQSVYEPIVGCLVENPVWQAPETLNNQPYDHRVDTYAFGVILWEMLTRECFMASFSHQIDIIKNIIAGKREPIPSSCPLLYAELIKSCWTQNPLHRPKMGWVLQKLSELTPMADTLEENIGKPYDDQLAMKYRANNPSKHDKIIASDETKSEDELSNSERHASNEDLVRFRRVRTRPSDPKLRRTFLNISDKEGPEPNSIVREQELPTPPNSPPYISNSNSPNGRDFSLLEILSSWTPEISYEDEEQSPTPTRSQAHSPSSLTTSPAKNSPINRSSPATRILGTGQMLTRSVSFGKDTIPQPRETSPDKQRRAAARSPLRASGYRVQGPGAKKELFESG